VIEVNDNPNIDRGIEDKYLGDELYRQIMMEFLRRMENSSKGV
jgi:glutathione synthase/RimK-type ligase-like ATP-grasp enzyme